MSFFTRFSLNFLPAAALGAVGGYYIFNDLVRNAVEEVKREKGLLPPKATIDRKEENSGDKFQEVGTEVSSEMMSEEKVDSNNIGN